ncbi:MAG: hypothetical protein JST64_06765 [Actinobacteria bacterium]|nr:hypothetical protein [Actinomycetota bacterium]
MSDDEPDGSDAVAPRELELAQEIHREIERFVADDTADVASLVSALDAIPRREQLAIARTVFDRLEPIQQWAVLERLLGDDGLLESLGADQRHRLASLRRAAATADLVDASVDESRLDLGDLPDGTEVVLGLFRPEDVRGAADRGRRSDVCARQLVLRATGGHGTFRVIDDVFNPRGGLFVGAAYDHDTWLHERLAVHSTVRIGSIVGTPGAPELEPAVYRTSRVDADVAGDLRPGRLRLGWATIGGVEVFPPAL